MEHVATEPETEKRSRLVPASVRWIAIPAQAMWIGMGSEAVIIVNSMILPAFQHAWNVKLSPISMGGRLKTHVRALNFGDNCKRHRPVTDNIR